jgi:hypothetical protein
MPSGIYKRTEETRRKITEALKRRLPISEETRLKMKLAQSKRIIKIQKNSKCIECGKEFICKNKYLKPKTCSRKCNGIFMSKKYKGKILPETLKKLSESHKGQKAWNKNKKCPQFSGSNCIFWKGGLSFEIYPKDWTKVLRISIRERDNYICQMCSKKQDEKAHDVHHIDYNKKNCNPNNLITLCKKCHMKTNNNRDYWLRFFNNNLK